MGPLSSLLPLVLYALSLMLHGAHPAHATGHAYLLKRFRGHVDGICLQGTMWPVSVENAESLVIGNCSLFQGLTDHVCVPNPPVAVFDSTQLTQSSTSGPSLALSAPADIPFSVQDSLPPSMTSASYSSPIWRTAPDDIVSFTAINALQARPLSVDGTPLPVDLASASTSDPSANVAVLPPQAASEFNITASDMLPYAQSYVARYFEAHQPTYTPHAAFLLAPDPSDPEGASLNAGYLVFTTVVRGVIAGHLMSASYSAPSPAPTPAPAPVPAPAPAPAGPGPADGAPAVAASTLGARRLLSLRGGRRRLSYYYYDGGSDSVGSRNCQLSCVLLSPCPAGCYNGASTWPACKYSCRCR